MSVHLQNKLDNQHNHEHIRSRVEYDYLSAHTKGISNLVRLIPCEMYATRDQNCHYVCDWLFQIDHLSVASLVPPLGLSNGEKLIQFQAQKLHQDITQT